jgi:hypothetical protein
MQLPVKRVAQCPEFLFVANQNHGMRDATHLNETFRRICNEISSAIQSIPVLLGPLAALFLRQWRESI